MVSVHRGCLQCIADALHILQEELEACRPAVNYSVYSTNQL